MPQWLTGAYLAWSLFIYYPRAKGDLHSWWPVFLYPLIWPLSGVIEAVLRGFRPALSSDWSYTVYDYLAGAFYIAGGTGWTAESPHLRFIRNCPPPRAATSLPGAASGR